MHDRRTDVNEEGWQVLSQFSHSASKKLKLRRYARRTNAISKKLVPHRAAFALHIAFYNWCRVHETLRVTPAIELGLINHIWSIGELLREAEAAPPTGPPRPSRWGRKPVRFRMIRGGRIR